MTREWIKMSDRKPEEGQRCWYYFCIVGVHAGTYSQVDLTEFGLSGFADQFSGKRGFLTDDVTHWMPYDDGEKPNAPKGGSDADKG
jgi:hypothetical protein